MVEHVVEVVGRSSRVQIRPQEVHHPLPVQSVARRESEQLDEARRLPQAPSTLLDGPSPHDDLEAAEQPDAYGLRSAGVPLRIRSRLGLRPSVCHLNRPLPKTMITREVAQRLLGAAARLVVC